MANSKLYIVGLVSAICMSGCATTDTINFGTEHRAAVEDANNKQVVSREAVKGAPVLHPAMSAAAIQRYLDDDVKDVEKDSSFGPGG